MTGPADIHLVNGVLRGDARSEELLYRRFSVPMFRVCLRYAANRQEAEDMLQEGFMRVFTDLRDFRGEGSLEGWIRRVVIRSALRWLRRRRAFESLDGVSDSLLQQTDESPEPDLLIHENCLVTELLQQLPPGYRTVLNLHVIEGYSHEEIAGLLGIHVGTSRSQLSKARTTLRKLLETKGIHPMSIE